MLPFRLSLPHLSQISFHGASYEFCEKPVVAGGKIWRIRWVQ
uniref:Uncharacterized protein n=1 Tax=Lepeophtheirus salmonis TaxID=72036 RepID=A0A0K2V1R9_LEPSM